jgi:glycosyltransferase involved in cell wall biosynthesis
MIVMMICHYDDTNPMGGLEKQARLLSSGLRSSGYNVVVLASTRQFSRAGWTYEDGVPVRYFWTYTTPQVSGRHLPAALLWAIQILIWIFLNRSKVSVLHCHQIRIHAFIAAMASKLWKIPSILKSAVGGTGADIWAIGSRKYFGPVGRRFIIRNTSVFIAITPAIADDLLLYGVPNNRIRMVPNGIEWKRSSKTSAAPEVRARRGIFLGRLAPDKNPLGLALAAADVACADGFQVDFYGRGCFQEKLEATLRMAGNTAVVYRGWVTDAGSVLPDYGYMLLPSSAEGLSNAMIEGMANGVVPIATKISGFVDHIVPGQNGFFFDGTDHSSLVKGLEMIEAIPADRWSAISRSAEEYAKKHFEFDAVCRQYLTLYADLVSTRPTGSPI